MAVVFEKTNGLVPGKETHYCPGCTHGIIHRLVGEVLVELGVLDKAVGVAPVGCSVLAYEYFNCDMHEASHGRAPAVATGIKRVLPENVVFTYQGDGDLASIGTAEIVHAAHRGEKITTIFVNNAIYGMTGGQMAPTTLIGQKATTAPLGRTVAHSGMPLKVSEMFATIHGAAFIERVSVDTAPNIRKAKKAIKEAFQCQLDGKGFSMVEVLSTCPTNWGMTPVDSLKWLKDNMMPYYPLGNFRRPGRMSRMLNEKIICAGFGGQGVMSMGQLLTYAGMIEGKEVSWLPSYGPEMRGGTANCNVLISDSMIGSPIITDNATTAIVMNLPSLTKFESDVVKGGRILVNSSLIEQKVTRDDVEAFYIPANEIAVELGNGKAANMVMLGAYLALVEPVAFDSIIEAFKKVFGERKAHLIPLNEAALKRGAEALKG